MADRLHETPRNVQLEGCKFKRNFWKEKKNSSILTITLPISLHAKLGYIVRWTRLNTSKTNYSKSEITT